MACWLLAVIVALVLLCSCALLLLAMRGKKGGKDAQQQNVAPSEPLAAGSYQPVPENQVEPHRSHATPQRQIAAEPQPLSPGSPVQLAGSAYPGGAINHGEVGEVLSVGAEDGRSTAVVQGPSGRQFNHWQTDLAAATATAQRSSLEPPRRRSASRPPPLQSPPVHGTPAPSFRQPVTPWSAGYSPSPVTQPPGVHTAS
eukprot:TRINITY_DN9293_c1_g1_i1.p2 TRINITY_DN9293_c1_g1~~TRINITY_DN9293_c1_g1_i1.p2  ORF type:complete len:199 (+),score=61.02 TRINITY_DN9293_c1_g1_i1:270-866(+)